MATNKKSIKKPKAAKPVIASKLARDGHHPWRQLAFWFGIPVLVYFVFFCFYTWPWAIHFNSGFFTDTGDGLQNVWNVWWVNKSVTQLHQLPWHTMFLHWPYGVSLLGQTLNPFNGFVGIALQHVFRMSLAQAFNTMITFSFISAGLTTFWLCYYFTKSYIPSLIGGFIFTFSSYHFAHAIGHMQLVSLEWIPLFILLWWKLLKKPSSWLAAGAAIVLLLVLFCDYYYFLYSLSTAAAIGVYLWRKKELPSFAKYKNWLPLAVFGGLILILVMPLPIALLRLNSRDMLLGSHPARLLSTDLFSPLIDGGFWRFHSWTNFYWGHVKAFVSESSVYLGVSIIGLLVYSWFRRKKLHKDLGFWQGLVIVFGIFSLGPRLLVFGYSINHAPLPYVLLERIVPGLKLSGVPVRMMVMVTLGAAVVSAMVLSQLKLQLTKHRLALVAFVLILSFEMWPLALPFTPNTYPRYVAALRNLPSTGGVLDNGARSEPEQLYDQTLFDKPMILGYISRTPQSVANKDAVLVSKISPAYYAELCSIYKLRYITTPIFDPLQTTFPIVYRDKTTLIYDLKNSPNC